MPFSDPDLSRLFKPDHHRTTVICAHWEEEAPRWVSLPGDRYQLRYCDPCLRELYARLGLRLQQGHQPQAQPPTQPQTGQSLPFEQPAKHAPEDLGATMFDVLDDLMTRKAEPALPPDAGLHICETLDCLWNNHRPEAEWGT